jgi:hypothetical protein
LVLVISFPLMVAAHHRAAPPRPRGGRPALAGERNLEPIRIDPPLTTIDALFGADVERNVSNHLAHLGNVRSFLDRARRIPVQKTSRGGLPPWSGKDRTEMILAFQSRGG